MEWISGVMDAVVKGFNAFVSTFKKHGIIYGSVGVASLVVVWSLILHPIRIDTIVEQRLKQQFEQQAQQAQQSKTDAENKRMVADNVITPLMDEIVSRFDVEHALLLELHNNSQNISGIDFLHFTATYESIKIEDYDVDYIADNFRNQYTSQLFDKNMWQRLSHADYLYYPNIKEFSRQQRFTSKLAKIGERSVMLIPIRGQSNKPLLIIAICSHKDEINAAEIYEYIKPHLAQVENALI